MRRLTAPLVRRALVLGLLLTAVGCGDEEKDRVTIMVPWTGTEFEAFHSLIDAFEKSHPGIDVQPQVTRDLTPQLDAAGAAPDLAVLPSVGALTKFRNDKRLQPIEIDTKAFVQPFRELAMHGDVVYAVPVKADVKSLVWYDPEVIVPPPPNTWAALASRPESWCLGLASGPTSGWPGADWIADILLAEEGVDVYKDWASGTREWKSQPVAEAWSTWRDLIDKNEKELSEASVLTFDKATEDMKDDTCSLSHGALSAQDFEADQVRTYTYVKPPKGQPLEVSADFVVKFTGDDSAEEFVRYLATAKAQQAWADAPGFALSAHKDVTRYGNSTQGQVAAMLRSGHTLCFSAADAMDPDVSAAFYRAVLEYVNGADLKGLLGALDRVRQRLGTDDSPPSTPLCGTPNQP
ncbi:ABC transporter substrate-binding protein [Streptomyces shaanxiensis]|uniref:ABC transporter substrate-binding protein n=1 Tax=Streptomyces shaanxiensis TaxID=653357 RepID=A0ABP7VM45_9ACTN